MARVPTITKKSKQIFKGTPETLATMLDPADMRCVYLPDRKEMAKYRARLYSINKNNINPVTLFTRYDFPYLWIGRIA